MAVPKRFTDIKFVVVQTLFEGLCEAYQVGRGVGFSNAAGTAFVVALVNFLQRASSPSHFKCLCSTATGAEQPGALSVKWCTAPNVELRELQPTLPLSSLSRDRYADVVIYDFVNRVTVAVFEVKQSEEDPCRAKKNEQMADLWEGRQRVMLGLVGAVWHDLK